MTITPSTAATIVSLKVVGVEGTVGTSASYMRLTASMSMILTTCSPATLRTQFAISAAASGSESQTFICNIRVSVGLVIVIFFASSRDVMSRSSSFITSFVTLTPVIRTS